jgi:hypothetical protein
MISIFGELVEESILEYLSSFKDEIRDPYVYQMMVEYEYIKQMERIGCYD